MHNSHDTFTLRAHVTLTFTYNVQIHMQVNPFMPKMTSDNT